MNLSDMENRLKQINILRDSGRFARVAHEEMLGGMMLCGYNPGRSKKVNQENSEPKSFSDSFNRSKFNKQSVKWLNDIFGYKLETKTDGEITSDNSISQTNWLAEASHSINFSPEDYIKKIDQFTKVLDPIRPSILFLFGITMFYALCDDKCQPEIGKILGKPEPIPFNDLLVEFEPPKQLPNYAIMTRPTKAVFPSGRRFWFGYQQYEKCKVFGLPHPTGSRGIQGHYIELAGKPFIKPALENYKIGWNTNKKTSPW